MRKLVISSTSFAISIFIAHFILPHNLLLLTGVVFALLSGVGMFFYGNKRLRIMIIFISLSVGFIWSWVYTEIFIAPHWEKDDETIVINAVITDYPVVREPRGFHVDAKIQQNGLLNIGARLYYYTETKLEPGDIIKATAKIRRTDITSDGDRLDSLSSRGIFLSAAISENIEIIGRDNSLRFIPKRIAQTIANKVEEIYPEDVSHFLKALLMGKRDDLYKDASLSAALSASGIIHVVSISGMHIAFLMGFLSAVIRNKRLFAFYGIPVLFLFMAMSGFTPAVSRAGMMQILLICSPFFRRESDSLTSLFTALLLLLIINPYSCASVGLQLSFSATLGIILFTTRINKKINSSLHNKRIMKKAVPKTIIEYGTSSFATTIGALIFTIPLAIIHFGYVSLIAPITNLLTLFIVSFTFPVGLIVTLIGFIQPTIATYLELPVVYAARYIIFIARSFATIPYGVIYNTSLHIIFWLFYVYIMFMVLPIMKARLRQYLYPVCISLILLFTIVLLFVNVQTTGEDFITVLDVGQGMSVVVGTSEFTMLIDCGSSSTNKAGEIAHEYLIGLGRTKLDVMVITHFHSDHINGIEFLLGRMSVSTLFIPDPDGSYHAKDIIELARKQQTDIIYVSELHEISIVDLQIFIYPPMGFSDENERGISVLTTGSITALITGDMGQSTERSLMRYANLPKLDLLVVGHHGSRNSTSIELLQELKPDIAIIPVGRNSFGHPHTETLTRLSQANVIVYRTDELGHVTVVGSREQINN